MLVQASVKRIYANIVYVWTIIYASSKCNVYKQV